jgi:hypothetical protein
MTSFDQILIIIRRKFRDKNKYRLMNWILQFHFHGSWSQFQWINHNVVLIVHTIEQVTHVPSTNVVQAVNHTHLNFKHTQQDAKRKKICGCNTWILWRTVVSTAGLLGKCPYIGVHFFYPFCFYRINSKHLKHRIWGPHTGGYEEFYLLRYSAV